MKYIWCNLAEALAEGISVMHIFAGRCAVEKSDHRQRLLRRAASGQAAAAPPSSVMNLRRFMSSLGDFLPIAADWPVCPVFRRFSLPQGGRQILGAELKCSESKRGGLPLMCL